MSRWVVVAAMSSLCRLLAAQSANEGFVMENEGVRHQLDHPAPTYPPIAKAAHVQGSVLLHVDVDELGRVTKVEAIGGPGMLKGAAVDVVKHWRYEPFMENGKPKAVTVVVEVPFSLGVPSALEKTDDAVGQAFFPKETECRNATAAGRWKDAVDLCAQTVALAERFPDAKRRQNEIRGAYQIYGTALMSSGDPKAALGVFEKAVLVANSSLTPTDAEYASAYLWRAIDEHILRMPDEAGRDYRIAESSYRKAIVSLPDMTKPYSYSLSRALAYHSVLEKQTGHSKESDDLRNAALQLNSHAMDGLGGDQ